MIVLADKFNQSVFRESLRKMFEKSPDTPEGPGCMQMGFGATIEVISSREVKISGAIGPCASLEKRSSNVAETEVGVGGTTQWYMGGIDPSATMSFFLRLLTPMRRQCLSISAVFCNFLLSTKQAWARRGSE